MYLAQASLVNAWLEDWRLEHPPLTPPQQQQTNSKIRQVSERYQSQEKQILSFTN